MILVDGLAAARAVAFLRGGHVTHCFPDGPGAADLAPPAMPSRCLWCGETVGSWHVLLRLEEKWTTPLSVHYMGERDVPCNACLTPSD